MILERKNEPNIDGNLHFSDFFWPGDHHHFQPGDGHDVGLLLLLATSDIFSNPVTGISEEICYGSSSRNIHKAVQSQVNSYIHMMPHTLPEPSLRKQKCPGQTANAGAFQWPLERWEDVPQLFWMGDFGDIPPKLIFWAPKC